MKGSTSDKAQLKRGTLWQTLERIFSFMEIRIAKVSKDLAHILHASKFMDSEVPTKDTYRKSTLYRWQDQAREVYTI